MEEVRAVVDLVLRLKRVAYMRPVLERVLLGRERAPARRDPQAIVLAARTDPDISLKVLSP